jgi:hypothetical protein
VVVKEAMISASEAEDTVSMLALIMEGRWEQDGRRARLRRCYVLRDAKRGAEGMHVSLGVQGLGKMCGMAIWERAILKRHIVVMKVNMSK